MRTEDSRSFEDVVSAEQAGLLRLAVLLAGDPGPAEELVQTALVTTYRHWSRISRPGAPSAFVRHALVSAHTSPRRRLSTSEQVMESVPDRLDPFGVDEELRGALRALPPRTRAAVVLRFYEGLSEQETADLLGCSAGTVAAETARGLALLPAEGELRTRLEALAEGAAPPLREPADVVAAVVDRGRVLRRRRWAFAAAAVVVLLLVPAVRSWTAPVAPTTPAAADHDVYGSPTRGALADDAAVLAAVAALPWAFDGYPESDAPPVSDRHVVWAGDVENRRWALVAGPDPTAPQGRMRRTTDRAVPGAVALAWFQGGPTHDVGDMHLRALRYGVDPRLPAAFLDAESRMLIIVGDPDDEIEVSRRPRIEADGSLSRRFDPEPDWNGVAVVLADSIAPVDLALRYRVLRNGSWITGVPDSDGVRDAGPPGVSVELLRPLPPEAPGDAAAGQALTDALARTDLHPSLVSTALVWAGDLPRDDGGSARLTVLTMEVPTGAVYVMGALGWETGGAVATASCGSEIRTAGTPVGAQVYVLRCTSGSRSGPLPVHGLVVVAPPGAATARALDSTGAEITRIPLVDGVAVQPLPADLATVEVLDADGNPLDRREPLASSGLDD